MSETIRDIDGMPASPAFPVRRFTVEEYQRMGRSGIFQAPEQVELLEGWIVPKTNHNPPHTVALMLVEAWLRQSMPDSKVIRVQMPITTPDSEPEPDIVVVDGPIRRYLTGHPQGIEVSVAIEVADSSLSRDREKCRIYAHGGVQRYLILNLTQRSLEFYTLPIHQRDVASYSHRVDFTENESFALDLPDWTSQRVLISSLLP